MIPLLIRLAAADVSLETDPSTFAFHGYAGHVRVSAPDDSPLAAWTLGVGAYAMDFPAPFRDLALSTDDTPDLRLQRGVGVFIDRSLHGSPWFVGAQVAHHTFTRTSTGAGASGEVADYSTALLMPRVGYEWQIVGGLYATPWAGVGVVAPLNTDALPAEESVRPVLPFGALHIGYRFGGASAGGQ